MHNTEPTQTSDWLQLDTGHQLQHLHGIVQTSDQSIWLQLANDDPGESGLLQCEANGRQSGWFQHELMPFPHGMEVYDHPRHGECLLVTDIKSGVALFDRDRQLLWHVEKPDFYKLHWTLAWAPSNCALVSDGRIVLSDGYGSGFLTVLSPDGEVMQTLGGPGVHGVVHPHGVAVMRYQGDEVIVVGECQLSSHSPAFLKQHDAQSCLKIFSLGGDYLGRVEVDTMSPRHFRRLTHDRWLMPDFQGRLLVLNNQLGVVGSIGQDDRRFSRAVDVVCRMPRPHDACRLADGRLLVTDFTGTVHVLNQSVWGQFTNSTGSAVDDAQCSLGGARPSIS